MIHALHLTTWHPYIAGVSGSFIVQQCEALRNAGIDVGLLFSRVESLRNASPANFWRGWPGVIKVDAPVPAWGFKSWGIPGSASMVPQLTVTALASRYREYISARGKPDVLHAHVALEAGPAALKLAEDYGIDYLVTEHSSEILRGMVSERQRRVARNVYRSARTTIAVSDALAEQIRKICPETNIRVIGNLVPKAVFDKFCPVSPDQNDITVISIAHLEANKGLHLSIRSLGQLPISLRARVTLHIVGGGPERGRLQSEARANGVRTVFHGYLTHERAMSLLAEADLLLHPSAYETFGMVLAEAAALGVPTIATRCGGPEAVVTEQTGILVDLGRSEQLDRAVLDVISDISVWRSKRLEISAIARARFHESVVASSIIEAYR